MASTECPQVSVQIHHPSRLGLRGRYSLALSKDQTSGSKPSVTFLMSDLWL